MRLVYTQRARRHLLSIKSYLAERNPDAATRVLGEIRESLDLLTEFPVAGRESGLPGVRELVVLRYPYIVAYRVESRRDLISVLGVFHAAQGERPM